MPSVPNDDFDPIGDLNRVLREVPGIAPAFDVAITLAVRNAVRAGTVHDRASLAEFLGNQAGALPEKASLAMGHMGAFRLSVQKLLITPVAAAPAPVEAPLPVPVASVPAPTPVSTPSSFADVGDAESTIAMGTEAAQALADSLAGGTRETRNYHVQGSVQVDLELTRLPSPRCTFRRTPAGILCNGAIPNFAPKAHYTVSYQIGDATPMIATRLDADGSFSLEFPFSWDMIGKFVEVRYTCRAKETVIESEPLRQRIDKIPV